MAKLGEAVLSEKTKSPATAPETGSQISAPVGGAFGKVADIEKSDKSAAPQKPKLPSTSEQAVIEMLRRHDLKSKEIDLKIAAETDDTADKTGR